MSEQAVTKNLRAWKRGEAKLDVRAFYDALAVRYGADSPTNYAAALWLEVADLEAELKRVRAGYETDFVTRVYHLRVVEAQGAEISELRAALGR